MPSDLQVEALDFAPDGSSLAAGCNVRGISSILLLDPNTGEQIGQSEQIEEGDINHLRFSSDGANIVTSHGGTARTWDTAMLQASLPEVSRESTPTSDAVHTPVPIVMVAFSPHADNILAVAHEDGAVQLWDFMSLSSKVIFTAPARPETLSFDSENVILTWSSDGSRLADRKSTRLNSSHSGESRMPSSA